MKSRVISYCLIMFYFSSAFSLTEWLLPRSLTEGNLDPLSQSLLLEELGVAFYMNEELCDLILFDNVLFFFSVFFD